MSEENQEAKAIEGVLDDAWKTKSERDALERRNKNELISASLMALGGMVAIMGLDNPLVKSLAAALGACRVKCSYIDAILENEEKSQ